MEGKLIKRNEHYFFWSSDWNPDKKEGFVANTTNLLPTKLSLKNCEAIANGYDLDELAENSSEVHEGTYNPQHKVTYKHGFIDGFQKAIEILGDKKFSEKDMSKAWSEGYHRKVDELNGNGLRYFDKFIQSLQQTEWDVEVEMEKCGYCEGCNKAGMLHCAHADSCGFPIETERPKLDANGCIILKRK